MGCHGACFTHSARRALGSRLELAPAELRAYPVKSRLAVGRRRVRLQYFPFGFLNMDSLILAVTIIESAWDSSWASLSDSVNLGRLTESSSPDDTLQARCPEHKPSVSSV